MRADPSPPVPSGYPAGNTYPAEYDANLHQYTRYLRALRRRWPVLVVFTVLGLVVGWFTTPSASTAGIGSTQSFFEATHILVADSTVVVTNDEFTDGQGGGVDLNKAAFFATAGQVPQMVADELGIEVSEVEGQVGAKARSDVSSLEITGLSDDATRAQQLADITAEKLSEFLTAEAAAQYDAAVAAVAEDIAALQAERDVLRDRLANGDGDPNDLEAQITVINNQLQSQIARQAALGEPPLDSGLSTVEVATARQISEDSYDAQRETILEGPSQSDITVAGQGIDTTIAGPPEDPDPLTRAALGGFLGLLLSAAIVVGIDRFDTRLRRRDDVESVTGLPVLAEIPPLSRQQQHSSQVVAAHAPRSRAAEAYRVVRSAIVFTASADQALAAANPPDGSRNGEARPGLAKATAANGTTTTDGLPDIGHQVLLVTSPGPAEGKTTTVANLAAVLAEGGLSVLVVNCDFRRPSVHKYLTPPDGQTEATELKVNQGGTTFSVRAVKTGIPKVRLITGIGENDPDANPLEIVAVQRRIVQSARQHFDVVLLDTAPILTTNDASELLPECDQVIMVVRNGKTRRQAAQRTAEVLTRFDAPLLGVVFNGSDDTPAVQYYYNYYLDHGGKRVRSPGYLSPSADAAPPAPLGS